MKSYNCPPTDCMFQTTKQSSNSLCFKPAQLSSRWYLCARKSPQLCVRPVSESPITLPLEQFQCLSDWCSLFLVLSTKIIERLLFPCLYPSGDRSCDDLGFVPSASVSVSLINTSDLPRRNQVTFYDGCFAHQSIGHFPWRRHVQGSTSIGVFEGAYRTQTHATLGFPFHFSLL